MIHIVGIDSAKDTFDVCLVSGANEPEVASFANGKTGMKQLQQWLKQRAVKTAHVCLEATGVYGDLLAETLYERGFTVRVVNPSLTLAGIPPEVFHYRLGNRSALEWVIDQYQVTTDKRSGITSDPNCADDPRYIVDLVARVVTVSLETVWIVAGLPPLYSSVSKYAITSASPSSPNTSS